jgi:hypothetical protein
MWKLRAHATVKETAGEELLNEHSVRKLTNIDVT